MIAKKIFYQLLKYARQHLHGVFEYTTTKVQDENGDIYYEVALSQNDVFHHLRFNDQGILVGREIVTAVSEEIEV